VLFKLVLEVKLVKVPELGVEEPILLGDANVEPFNKLAFKLGIFVVLAITRGAIPDETVEVNCPLKEAVVPDIAPIVVAPRLVVPAVLVKLVLAVKLVNVPELGVEEPILLGDANVEPFNKLEFKLGIFVVLAITSGAVPVETDEVICPVKEAVVPVIAPIVVAPNVVVPVTSRVVLKVAEVPVIAPVVNEVKLPTDVICVCEEFTDNTLPVFVNPVPASTTPALEN
jgi:hypothetical protein